MRSPKNKTIEAPAPAPATKPDHRAALSALFEIGMVIPNFEYQGITMDYAVIAKDRLIEIRHILTKKDYATELSTIGRAGRLSFDKHKAIQTGKFVTNAFYFLAPPRILAAHELPPKYGLIIDSPDGLVWRQQAEYFKEDEYLTRSFYKTLAEKLVKQLYGSFRRV